MLEQTFARIMNSRVNLLANISEILSLANIYSSVLQYLLIPYISTHIGTCMCSSIFYKQMYTGYDTIIITSTLSMCAQFFQGATSR